MKSPVRNKILTGLFLFVIFALVHGSVVIFERSISKDALQGRNFEDLEKIEGDHTFFRNGVLSLLKYNFRERVQVFHSARIDTDFRLLKESSIGTLENAYAALYPFPPSRSGFSWTGAVLTVLIPSVVFEKVVPRVVFINLVLTLLCVAFLYWLSWILTHSTVAAIAVCSFFLTDVALLHTNYHSQSSNLCGIFWWLMAWGILLKSQVPRILIGLALSLAVHSSPHLVPWVAAAGLVFLVLSEKKDWLWILAGALIPSLYLISVDGILDLKGKGIPGYIAHLQHSFRFEGGIVETIPILHRWMWDLRAIQPHILIIILSLGGLTFWKRSVLKTRLQECDKRLLLSVGTVFLLGSALSFVAGIPTIRLLLPFMALLALFMGLLWGGLWEVGPWGSRALLLLTLGLWAGSSLYSFDWVSEKPRGQPQHFVSLDDRPVMGQNHLRYFRHIRTGTSEPYRHEVPFEFWTHSLGDLLAKLEKEPIEKGDLYIELRPTFLVDAYSSTNRFYPKMVRHDWHGLKPEILKEDFRLYEDFAKIIKEKQLKGDELLVLDREKWELGNWDHETGYWLKFKNGFRSYAEGLALQDLDMRKLYYFKYSALKQLLKSSEVTY